MAEDTTKDAPTVRRTSPLQFFQEVRREATKVTWPTWKETWLTSVMVFIMVALAMLFFFFVDSLLGIAIRWLFGIV